MRFVLRKQTGGWWFVQEIVTPPMVGGEGILESDAIAVCHRRNKTRLENKQTSARMASKQYRMARSTYPAKPTVRRLNK